MEGFMEVVLIKMRLKLSSNHPFKGLKMKQRLDMGLYWFRSVGSAPGFLRVGVIAAIFKMGIQFQR